MGSAMGAWVVWLRSEVAAVVARTGVRMSATTQWLSLWLAGLTIFGVLIMGSSEADLVTRLRVVMFGLVDGLLLWSAMALATNGQVSPERANSRSFTELRGRLEAARRRLGSRGESAVVVSLREQIRSLERRSMPGDLDPPSGAAAWRTRQSAGRSFTVSKRSSSSWPIWNGSTQSCCTTS